MSRSGYIEDDGDDPLSLGRWRGQVASALRGKRGQSALRELAAAMDAMPHKTLAAESLMTANGEFCTLGVLGQARGLDMSPIDVDDWDAVADAFNLAPAMVREIVYENDEGLDSYKWVDVVVCGPVRPWHPDYGKHQHAVRVAVPEEILGPKRWQRMRAWVQEQLTDAARAQRAEDNDNV